jgi:hypothetical protein
VRASFVAISAVYGFRVEYRFEVMAIAVDWTILIVVGALLAFAYRAGALALTEGTSQQSPQ